MNKKFMNNGGICMNNKLVFDVMDLHETTLMHVKCIEGEGLTVCINDMFERFSDKYSDSES